LELAMLEGKLKVRDLPEAWRARYESDLGITPTTDSDGVLQDVHWYSGLIGGYFHSYTLGNILSAQFFDAAIRSNISILSEIENGKLQLLHSWLKENIYQHGAKFTPNELIERVTGAPLRIEPYIHYLKQKYSVLYPGI
jgi:carboxypeptidase Taq